MQGITPNADTADLLASANTATLKAYRGLIAAVPVLDGIASLRMQMATIAGIGSPDLLVANFLGSADSELVLEGAANTWRGEMERVQYDLPGLGGSYLAKQARPRLGGRWLALVSGAYDVRLSTAAQVVTLLHQVQA